jgi:hypothetical protein
VSGLDVERLAWALHNSDVGGCWSVDVPGTRSPEPHPFDHDDARKLAAEYARLAESRPRDGLADAVARAIYDAMRENDPEGRDRPWVPGGNSRKQEEARSRARAALAEAPR